MTITEAGLYFGLPADAYHADPCHVPSLSSGLARLMLDRSPRHAWLCHPKLNPDYAPSRPTDFDLGTAAHVLLLEGRRDDVVAIQATDWRTKAAREQRDAVLADGKMPILADQAGRLLYMVEAATRYLEQSELGIAIANNATESTVIWTEGHAWCRARPDLISEELKIVVDYKTTAGSAAPEAFIRGPLFQMGYDFQAAFYLTGMTALGIEDYRFVFLVQETTAPYACSLVGVSHAMLDLGLRKVDHAIRLWQRCMDRDDWPAYPSRIAWADLPAYHEARWQERMSVEAMEDTDG